MDTLSYKKDKKILTFQTKGETYTIGSKLFPLSKKKNIGLWHSNNTQEVKGNEKLLQFLDMVSDPKFITGKCYRNAEVVRQIGERLGFNIKIYSGWVFNFDPMPIHHSWNVLDNRILIDTSLTKTNYYLNQKMIEWAVENENFTKDEYRHHYVNLYEEEMKKNKPISQDVMYGKVPVGLAYYGTEDTYQDSMDRISSLLHDIQPHPAYLHKINELHESETQLLLKEKGLFK